MSVRTQIDRIAAAKQAIIAAIRNKGVNVPDGVMIEDLPAYIDMITGGGSVSVTDDGNGNVTIEGLTVSDDGSGNLTISGTSASDNNGNVKIGE